MRYSVLETLFCQWPVSIPNPVTAIKITTTPIATAFLLLFFFEKTGLRSSVSATGQASTQLKHVLHSSEITVFTLSTLIDERHALAQSPQSIQLTGFLLILFGLNNDAIPRSAPYGHKNLHQKFLMKIDPTKSTAITIKDVLDISAKK